MLAAALLALSLSHGVDTQPNKLDQLAQPAVATTTVSKAVPVILDCQIAAKALTDCRAVDEAAADAGVVAEAVRMAATVAVPDALADSGVRIRIRMNVAP
jgi:methylmalonyl-CoA mutase cobalamin-binding subunit